MNISTANFNFEEPLDYLIGVIGERSFCDEDDLLVILRILVDMQRHVNAMFPDVETLEKQFNTAVSSLHSEN